jgi:hypothetical protein
MFKFKIGTALHGDIIFEMPTDDLKSAWDAGCERFRARFDNGLFLILRKEIHITKFHTTQRIAEEYSDHNCIARNLHDYSIVAVGHLGDTITVDFS